MEAKKAEEPLAMLSSSQASPEEVKRDDMTPTKLIIWTPMKGTYQIGMTIIATVKGMNDLELKW